MTPTLNIIQGETWVREFAIDRAGIPLGEAGWDIEFELYAEGDPSSRLLRLEAGRGCEWLGPGLLRVVIERSQVNNLDVDLCNFLMVVRDPSTTVATDGVTWALARGVIEVFGIEDAGPRAGRSRERMYLGSDGVRTRVFGLGEGTAVTAPPPAPAPAPNPVGAVSLVAAQTTVLNGVHGMTYLGTVADDAELDVASTSGFVGTEFSVVLNNTGDNTLLVVESASSTQTFNVPAEFSQVLLVFKKVATGVCTLVTRHFIS